MGVCLSCSLYCKKWIKEVCGDSDNSIDPEGKPLLLDNSNNEASNSSPFDNPNSASHNHSNSTYDPIGDQLNYSFSANQNPNQKDPDWASSINLAFDFGTVFSSFGFLMFQPNSSSKEGFFNFFKKK